MRASTESHRLKRDLLIAVVAILVVAGVCFGLAANRLPFKATPSHPFSFQEPTVHGSRVVLRINGQPVTQDEFEAAFRQLPEQMQRQFGNEPGKVAFAEQIVRMKLLEQEARRLGLENDPKVAGQLAAQRTDILAAAAAEKVVPKPSEEAVRKFYEENKGRLTTIDVSHILIAYAGGTVPPRDGGAAPSESDAVNKALFIYDQLKQGADFADLARKYSDDETNASRGGELGPMSRGMLPRELEAQVFRIPVGQFSGPIPSQFGVHIFKVNSRGTRTLEQVRAPIVDRVRQEEMARLVEVLRKNAKVVFDPKFFPDTAKPPAGRKSS
jgi:peptidyl-prolyl cis-trans isomerase C